MVLLHYLNDIYKMCLESQFVILRYKNKLLAWWPLILKWEMGKSKQ
jgi:hypothetical protein